MIMEFKILHILLAFMAVAVAASEAAFSPEMYWKSKLPNTPMPQAIRDILHPDLLEDKSTSVDVGKGGVVVTAPGKVKPLLVGARPGSGLLNYDYAATETEVRDDPNGANFFLEKDLVKGKTMTLHFTRSTNLATFFPQEVAGPIPFSLEHWSEILNYFSVKPGSMDAQLMKTTIKECERPGIEGEEKYCATSLESMVDYAKSKLGENLQATSTETEKETLIMQNYKIEEDVKKIMAEESKYVVCHKRNYPYAVFYCHKMHNTKASVVPLKGEDGSEVKAVALCHSDTSKWNPKHLSFQVLGVEPGTVPICHFLPLDHVMWYATELLIKSI